MAAERENVDVTYEDAAPAYEDTPLLGTAGSAGVKAFSTGLNGSTISRHGSSADQDHHGSSLPAGPHHEDEDESMPYTQVVLLCFTATVDPVSYFAIFPIIGDMLVKIAGLPKKNIALQAGIIETLFSITQMLVMILYGKASDRIGRKPVLVFSLFGIAAAQALFGMSQSLWQMILLRCLTGFFAGSSVCVRAMLSEVTNKRTQARAFSWYMFARNAGIFIGPLIGGTLASPEANIPLFKNNQFFKHFPFSLSLFVCAGYTLISALVTLVAVKETLKSKIGPNQQVEPEMSTLELLKSDGVLPVLYITGHVALVALCYTAVSSIFYYEPVDLGGLGMKPNMISIIIALAGASQSLWMLLPFTPLQKRFGTGGVLRGCVYLWPLFLAASPLLNEVRRLGADLAFWIALPTVTLLGCGVAMAFTCTQLALNDVAPSPNTLGALNAIALTLNSAIRAVAPVAATALYEWGVKLEWLHGHLFWIVLVVIAGSLIVGVRFLPAKAEGKLKDVSVDEES